MIQPKDIDPIPEETARIARLAFPKSNTCIKMRDEIGTIFGDQVPHLYEPTTNPAKVYPGGNGCFALIWSARGRSFSKRRCV